jgi:sn-glycerol 3-phosphate transport system permease protein
MSMIGKLETTSVIRETTTVMPRKPAFPNWQLHVFLMAAIVIIWIPLSIAIVMSTQTPGEAVANPLLPGSGWGANIQRVIERDLVDFTLRSVAVSGAIAIGKTVLSLMAGLAFVFFRFPGKWVVFSLILFTLMLPADVLVIALFRFVSGTLDLGDTFIGLVAPSIASATGTFLFRQHFMSIPGELSEAAQLDGINPLQYLLYVLIPLSWNTIGALVVISFLGAWNMYLWPLTLITDPANQTIQLGLSAIIQGDNDYTPHYGPLMLGAIIASLPPLIVFLAMQRQFMSGFAITRDK